MEGLVPTRMLVEFKRSLGPEEGVGAIYVEHERLDLVDYAQPGDAAIREDNRSVVLQDAPYPLQFLREVHYAILPRMRGVA